MEGRRALWAKFLILFLAYQVSQATPLKKGTKVNCDNFLEKLDTCGLAASYSFVHDDYAYPIDEASLNKSCVVTHEGLECLKQYSVCLDQIIKQGFISFIKDRRARVNLMCKNTKSKNTQHTLEAFKCLHDNKKAYLTKGEEILLKKMDAMSSATNLIYEQRIQLACCTILEHRKLFLDILAPQCSKYANEVDNEIASLIGQITSLLCRKYNQEPQGCSNLPELTYPKHTKAKSLTRTILEILVSIGDKSSE